MTGRGQVKVISVTPAITTGAYAANDALGGSMTFSDARFAYNGGVIHSVTIVDKAAQDAEIDIVFFAKTFTATTDNAAFDPSDADLLNVVGHIKVEATDYVDFTDNSIATKTNTGLVFQLDNTSENLYAQMVVRDTPTYASTSDIVVKVGILRD